MSDFIKDLKLIDTFSRLIKLTSALKLILTVVIIAFSVITGARYITVPQKTE